MHEEEKEEKCTRKDKTNWEIERTRRIEERKKIRARASRRQWAEGEEGVENGGKGRKWKREERRRRIRE